MKLKMKLSVFVGVSAVIASFFSRTNDALFLTDAFIMPRGIGPIAPVKIDATSGSSSQKTMITSNAIGDSRSCTLTLLRSLLAKVPSNQSTPKELTREILHVVSDLEEKYPTDEVDVMPNLSGK